MTIYQIEKTIVGDHLTPFPHLVIVREKARKGKGKGKDKIAKVDHE